MATGKGEMRPAGLPSGVGFADFVMVEIRDPHAALSAEQITVTFQFSRVCLKRALACLMMSGSWP
jgi:hypothetical protein